MAVSKHAMRILELSLIFSCFAIAEAHAPPFTIHNRAILGSNLTGVTLTIYNDSLLKTPLNLTNIGSDAFNHSDNVSGFSYRTVYGVLQETGALVVDVTLNIYTENWNPKAIADYGCIYSFRNISSTEVTDFNGSTIEITNLQSTTMEIMLSLYVDVNQNVSSTFTFDIRFTATEQP